MQIALNKTSLKQQRDQAKTFRQYLPSLELKRQQLLVAFNQIVSEREQMLRDQAENESRLEPLYPLLGSSTIDHTQILSLVRVLEVEVGEENLVGTKLPVVRKFRCQVSDYSELVTPFWVDSLVDALKRSAEIHVRLQVADRRVERLEYAVRKITQRVNLFEKVLVPRAEENIRKIQIFLSDQERAAVVRSKLAKGKG
ncbi:MAG: V-type ATP synthase subunit D [Planctomycetota bacterium]